MIRVFLMVIAAALFGCADSETCQGDDCGGAGGAGGGSGGQSEQCGELPEDVETCTLGEANLRRCDGNWLEECDGCSWVTLQDCSQLVEGWTCLEPFPGVGRCDEPYDSATQYFLCGLGFGGLWYGECDPTLSCELGFDGTRCACVRACADHPELCDAETEFCDTSEFVQGACMALGTFDDPCADVSTCADGHDCMPHPSTGNTTRGCVVLCATDEECADDEVCSGDEDYNVSVCVERPRRDEPCQTGGPTCEIGTLCRQDYNGSYRCRALCNDLRPCLAGEYCDEDIGCLPTSAEFTECLPGSCAPGRVCSDVAGGSYPVCVRKCDTNPALCLEGLEYCDTSGRYVETACLPLVDEFDSCGEGVAGCRAGLTCSTAPGGSVCVRACADDPSLCYNYEYCDESGVYGESACLLLADELENCGDGVAECRLPLECSLGPGGRVCVRPCADDPDACGEFESCDTSGTYALSACVASANELQNCGPGVGICYLGLQCDPMGSKAICTRPCDGIADACDAATEYCATSVGSDGTCLPIGRPRDAPCISNEGCAAGLECQDTYGPTSTCKQPCNPLTIGTQGDCPANELCTATDSWEIQPGPVNCISGGPEVCDTSDGYECHGFPNITGPPTFRCGRPRGRCARELPLMTSLTIGDLGNLAATNNCERAGLSAECPDYSGTEVTADVSCEGTGYASTIQANGRNVPCGSDADCKFIGGELYPDAVCVNFSSGDVVCASLSQGCVAFCEPDEPGGEDKLCPPGTVCMAPSYPHEGSGNGAEQGGGAQCDSSATCTDSECVEAPTTGGGFATFCLAPCESDADCLEDNICMDAGFMNFCVHFPKVCLTPLTQEDNCSITPL